MVGATTDDAGQRTIDMTELGYVPPTVCEHEETRGGMKLETIDDNPESDIILYNDERPMHMVGNPPE